MGYKKIIFGVLTLKHVMVCLVRFVVSYMFHRSSLDVSARLCYVGKFVSILELLISFYLFEMQLFFKA